MVLLSILLSGQIPQMEPRPNPGQALQYNFATNALLGNKWWPNFVAGLAAGASTKRRPNLAPGPKNTAIPVDALVRVRGLQKLTAHRT